MRVGEPAWLTEQSRGSTLKKRQRTKGLMKTGRGETERLRHENYSPLTVFQILGGGVAFPTSLRPALSWIRGSCEGKDPSNRVDPGTAGCEPCGSTSTRVFKNKYLCSFQSAVGSPQMWRAFCTHQSTPFYTADLSIRRFGYVLVSGSNPLQIPRDN